MPATRSWWQRFSSSAFGAWLRRVWGLGDPPGSDLSVQVDAVASALWSRRRVTQQLVSLPTRATVHVSADDASWWRHHDGQLAKEVTAILAEKVATLRESDPDLRCDFTTVVLTIQPSETPLPDVLVDGFSFAPLAEGDLISTKPISGADTGPGPSANVMVVLTSGGRVQRMGAYPGMTIGRATDSGMTLPSGLTSVSRRALTVKTVQDGHVGAIVNNRNGATLKTPDGGRSIIASGDPVSIGPGDTLVLSDEDGVTVSCESRLPPTRRAD